ncbi:MAG: 6-phosphofructokinase [Oscillospiraceae bacterium]|nr:6-phosphofructokinase [Oscillospiraceae bacterium]
MAKRKIGILTSGGDCPGLNAAIRSVALACYRKFGVEDVELYGITDGFVGLLEKEYRLMAPSDFHGLLARGGTILGTKRTPHKKLQKIEEDGVDKVVKMRNTYNQLGLDCLLILGGNGTHKTANLLSENRFNVIGLPKTIDNDIFGTDVTFGFHTALEIGTEAIDRIRTTAESHSRIIVVEIMGNKSGWLALNTGIASGSNIILIPEIPFSDDKLVQAVRERIDAGEPTSVIVVAEGAKDIEESKMKKKELERKRAESGEMTVTGRIVRLVQEKVGIETRSVVPGHMLRGGTPSAYDRLLSTQFGARAAELIIAEKYGYTVAKIGNEITENKLSDMAGKPKLVDAGGSTVNTARNIGVAFGD